MDQEVIRRRNTVFTVIYRNLATHYAQYVPQAARLLVEVIFLIMALVTLSFWCYVHFTYVVEPEDCLIDIMERPFPYEDILQVEVYTNTTELWSKRQTLLVQTYASFSDRDMEHTKFIEEDTGEGREEVVEEEKQGIGTDGEGWFKWVLTLNSVEEVQEEEVDEYINERTRGGLGDDVKFTVPSYVEQHSLYELFDVYTLKQYSIDYTILEFSQEPGYLSLTQSARTRLNISTRKLYISPANTTCFGGWFGQFITKHFLGYDMMIIASFKNLLPLVQGSGYVKNLLTGNHYYYRVQWMGKWRYIAGLLPALFFTLIASVLLRQIHYHVFKFLTHFHHMLNEGIPMPIQTGAQIPFLIITYAAIGLVIVMSEALGDDSLFSLFMVATVWEADQFYAVFCRHHVSKVFFPMFFFLYHFIPYAYFVRFNGQFWFIPFVFHWFLLQNAMLFFFHNYEVNEQRAQPIILRVDIQHHAGQLPGMHIHLPQQQHQQEQQQQHTLEQQEPPLELSPRTANELPQHRDGREFVALRHTSSSPSSQQSDSQVSIDTLSGTALGSPVEESEEGRSAVFISTQSIMPPLLREAALVDVRQSRESITGMGAVVRPNRDGLRERCLMHPEKTLT